LPNLTGLGRPVSRHGSIMAVSMMKDEGPYLLEWVAHHLAIGFTDILVYTNDCSDGTDAMLIRLEDMGLAHHRRNVIPDGIRPQPSALSHAQDEPLVAAADWVMVFDADEFLCIGHDSGHLDGLLTAVKAAGAAGIVVTWRIFGSAGVEGWSRDPVTEQYRMCAPRTWNKGWGVKTLFRFDPEHWKLGIHRPKLKNKWLETGYPATVKWLNGSGQPMESYFTFRGWRSITRTVGYDWAQMNHYAVKSIDAYAMRKLRGNVNNKADKYNADYWALQDRNEVPDDTMLRWSVERSRILAALKSDPVLGPLHDAAVARAEARLAEIRQSPDYTALAQSLREASRVPIDRVTAKPPQARDPAKIAALMGRVEAEAGAASRSARVHARAARGPGFAGLLATGPVDMTADPPLAWHDNRGIVLPGDPRLFTPAALDLIAAGKYERNLARTLPRLLPPGGRYLEVGAGPGYIAALIAHSRPDAVVTATEADAGWQAAMLRIRSRNGLAQADTDATGCDGVHPSQTTPAVAGSADDGGHDLARLVARHCPDLLSLGDPTLAPHSLALALDVTPCPATVVMTHRLLSAQQAMVPAFVAILISRGMVPRTDVDAALALAFTRPN